MTGNPSEEFFGMLFVCLDGICNVVREAECISRLMTDGAQRVSSDDGWLVGLHS